VAVATPRPITWSPLGSLIKVREGDEHGADTTKLSRPVEITALDGRRSDGQPGTDTFHHAGGSLDRVSQWLSPKRYAGNDRQERDVTEGRELDGRNLRSLRPSDR
jgi:hypothetical protein